jgi:hypothetical protein
MNYKCYLYIIYFFNGFNGSESKTIKNFFIPNNFLYKINNLKRKEEKINNVIESINLFEIKKLLSDESKFTPYMELFSFKKFTNNFSLHMKDANRNKLEKSLHLYNEKKYLEEKLKIINAYIENINKHIKELESLQSFHRDIINNLHKLEMKLQDYIKNKKNILMEINKITSSLKIIYRIDEKLLENENFSVPFLNFDKNKIISYIFKSYYYRYNKFSIQNSLYDYFTQIFSLNLQLNKTEKNGFSFSINYSNQKLIRNIKAHNKNKFLYEAYNNYFYIKNLTYQIFILKEQEQHIENYILKIRGYINIISENKDINTIMDIYKKEKEILDLKMQMLDIFYKKIQNTWKIFLKLIPLELTKKFYEIKYVDNK